MGVISSYTSWHYREGLQGVFQIGGNGSWFIFHFFSIGFLLKTLFRPLLLEGEAHERNESFSDWAEHVGMNLIMRALGAGLRTALILVAVFLSGVMWLVVLCTALIWIFAPVLLVAFPVAAVLIGVIYK